MAIGFGKWAAKKFLKEGSKTITSVPANVGSLKETRKFKESLEKVIDKAKLTREQKTTGTEVTSSVEPSAGDKSLSKLKISTQKTKGGAAKLKHTLWQSKTGDWKKKGFTFDKKYKRTKTIDEKRYEEAQIKKD